MPTRFTPILASLLLASPSACGEDADPTHDNTVTVAARGGALFTDPLDAAPDDRGEVFLFLATDARGAPALLRVPAIGGDVTLVRSGAPLVAPLGLVARGSLARGDLRAWVADPTVGVLAFAHIDDDGADTPTVLIGSADLAPVALDQRGGALVIAGQAPGTSTPAILRLSVDGGEPSVLASGAPLVAPGGVALAPDPTVFVADRAAGRGGSGALLVLRDGRAQPLLDGLVLGAPAGVALSLDGQAVLVSALSAAGTSQVVVYARAAGAAVAVDDVIKVNHDSGGLHRAFGVDVSAWADRGGGRSLALAVGVGAVYRVAGADAGGSFRVCRDVASGIEIPCPPPPQTGCRDPASGLEVPCPPPSDGTCRDPFSGLPCPERCTDPDTGAEVLCPDVMPVRE